MRARWDCVEIFHPSVWYNQFVCRRSRSRLKCGSARHHRLWSRLQLNNSTEADAVKDDSFRGIHDDDDCKVVYSPKIQDSSRKTLFNGSYSCKWIIIEQTRTLCDIWKGICQIRAQKISSYLSAVHSILLRCCFIAHDVNDGVFCQSNEEDLVCPGSYLNGSHVTGQLVHSLLFPPQLQLPSHMIVTRSSSGANQLIDNHNNLIVTHATN